jgi:hypothetical protein
MKKWTLLAVGLLLLLPEAWYLVSDRVRPNDAEVAFKPLVVLPLDWFSPQHFLSFTVAIPEGAAWKRIRHSWGDPDYVIALISKRAQHQHCFDGLAAQVTQGGRQIGLENARSFYAFTSDSGCKSLGKMFHAPAGSVIQIHITGSERIAPDAELLMKPDWLYTKDYVVGMDVDADMRPWLVWSAVIGFAMVILAILLINRERRARTQGLIRSNVVSS